MSDDNSKEEDLVPVPTFGQENEVKAIMNKVNVMKDTLKNYKGTRSHHLVQLQLLILSTITLDSVLETPLKDRVLVIDKLFRMERDIEGKAADVKGNLLEGLKRLEQLEEEETHLLHAGVVANETIQIIENAVTPEPEPEPEPDIPEEDKMPNF